MSFLMSCKRVKRLQDLSEGIGILINKYSRSFSQFDCKASKVNLTLTATNRVELRDNFLTINSFYKI
jgi:hypothetical protein